MTDKPEFLSWDEAVSIVDSSLSYQDVVTASKEKNPNMAFCQRCSGVGKWDTYNVSTLGRACVKYVRRTRVNCPDCGHALFWSSKYYLLEPAITKEQREAREGVYDVVKTE